MCHVDSQLHLGLGSDSQHSRVSLAGRAVRCLNGISDNGCGHRSCEAWKLLDMYLRASSADALQTLIRHGGIQGLAKIVPVMTSDTW